MQVKVMENDGDIDGDVGLADPGDVDVDADRNNDQRLTVMQIKMMETYSRW